MQGYVIEFVVLMNYDHFVLVYLEYPIKMIMSGHQCFISIPEKDFNYLITIINF